MNASPIITGDHNTTTVNNLNLNISCTPAQKDEIVSFIDTDLDAVIQLVLQDPARFQLALQSGNLHEELCKATHFGDIDRYKKYLGHSREGVNMRVMQDDKVVVMEKRAGISTIMINNHKIANDAKTAEYFGKAPITCRDKVRQRISNVVQNKGHFVPKYNFYKDIPVKVPSTKKHTDMIKNSK
jgi:hypothetical protein